MTEQHREERSGRRGKADVEHRGLCCVNEQPGNRNADQKSGGKAVNQREKGVAPAAEKCIYAKDKADQHAVEAVGAQIQRALGNDLWVSGKQTDQSGSVPLRKKQAAHSEQEGQPDRQAQAMPRPVHQPGAIMLGRHGGKCGGKSRGGQHAENNELFNHPDRCRCDQT